MLWNCFMLCFTSLFSFMLFHSICICVINFDFTIRYRGLDENHILIKWFWTILEEFTNEERIQFLRFISGRTRLPSNPADITQRFQIMTSDRVSFDSNLGLTFINMLHCLSLFLFKLCTHYCSIIKILDMQLWWQNVGSFFSFVFLSGAGFFAHLPDLLLPAATTHVQQLWGYGW